ncbi:histidinol-phosphatase (PHP family) [Actinoplanes tereljensis]|uniref:Histidinol-phosphatase n=1 Tax=Paractinoplanes tereljensis TaxID=571912 RepID=A0A919NI26_9ACTN|nr:PHP domain-containing protein [Actinoplanes tereljensis]GIF18317.1 histidinol-phosphatase [Actinoplanes tereljensis]
MLPADGHVHSEWSWDAPNGSMERTCARAVEIGLPAVAFTEHADWTVWSAVEENLDHLPRLKALRTPELTVTPPPMDVAGYLECVDRCRHRFPDLRIITGIEVGEPHRHPAAVAALLDAGGFERVLGSLHCLPLDAGFAEPPAHLRRRAAADVVRDYLAEVPRVIAGSDVFGVLAHIDYAVRFWPADGDPFDVSDFEDEFRAALRALADSGRVLEINTWGPPRPELVRWWRDEGGEAVTFGSDAHLPDLLGRRFAEAVAVAEAHGFRAGAHPYDRWWR